MLEVNAPKLVQPKMVAPVVETTPVQSYRSQTANSITQNQQKQVPAYAAAPVVVTAAELKEKLKRQLYEKAQKLKDDISKENAQIEAQNYGSNEGDELVTVMRDMVRLYLYLYFVF